MLNIIPDFTDNNIVNIIRYGDDYYTTSEINYINQINPETLDTIRRVSANIIISWIFKKRFFWVQHLVMSGSGFVLNCFRSITETILP